MLRLAPDSDSAHYLRMTLLSVAGLWLSASNALAGDVPLVTTAAIPPAVLEYDILNTYPHDRAAFTQGLVYRDGFLYESTGLNGRSSLRKVKPESGEVVQREAVDNKYFAEGLTDWNNQLIQITWQSGVALTYDLKTFKSTGSFKYSGEGWGITQDGHKLIMSDGTATLRYIDPESHEETGKLEVTYEGKPLANLNELEFVRGRILANVWQSNSIVVIDPADGRVTAQINLPNLLTASDRSPAVDVLNGIAYNPKDDSLFVTGKWWPKVFEIKLKKTDLFEKKH